MLSFILCLGFKSVQKMLCAKEVRNLSKDRKQYNVLDLTTQKKPKRHYRVVLPEN